MPPSGVSPEKNTEPDTKKRKKSLENENEIENLTNMPTSGEVSQEEAPEPDAKKWKKSFEKGDENQNWTEDKIPCGRGSDHKGSPCAVCKNTKTIEPQGETTDPSPKTEESPTSNGGLDHCPGNIEFQQEELPPPTVFSNIVEHVVNNILNNLEPPVDPIYVRVMSYTPHTFVLNDSVANFYRSFGGNDKYPYMCRVLMVFQKVNEGFAAFFAAYLHEYGESCPAPNKNLVYLSVMDSVRVFQPPQYKHVAIRSTLLSIIDLYKTLGFTNMFLWSSPPKSKDTEYVFPGRPSQQKHHSQMSLNEWYSGFLTAATETGIIEGFSNLYDWCMEQPEATILDRLPLFEEDHWPKAIENVLRKYSRKIPKDLHQSVRCQIISELKAEKDSFFCMTLSPTSECNGKVKSDILGPVTACDLVDSRDNLFNFFNNNNLRFCDAVTAKAATRQLLLKIQNSITM